MNSELRFVGIVLAILASIGLFIHPAASVFAGLCAIGAWLDGVGQHIKPHE